MAEPIKWKSKLILAKPEAAYAVNPVLVAANAVLLTDVQLQPMEGEDVSRNLELPYLGAQEALTAGLRSVLTGTFELVGSGETGVAPGWSALIRAMGIAEVVTPDTVPGDGTGKVEYTPVTDDHESVALEFYIGPDAAASRYLFLGARGTGQLTVSANGIPAIRGTWTGLWTLPGTQAKPTGVDLSNFVDPQVATKANTPTFTIDAIPFVMRSFTLDFANDVQARMLVGREAIIIVDRNETIAATVEAVPLGTYNPYARASATPKARFPIVVAHGTVAGRRVRIDVPKATQNRATGFENQQGVLEWPLNFTPMPDAGDDQWKITLS